MKDRSDDPSHHELRLALGQEGTVIVYCDVAMVCWTLMNPVGGVGMDDVTTTILVPASAQRLV